MADSQKNVELDDEFMAYATSKLSELKENTELKDSAMAYANGGITFDEYMDGVYYLLFGDAYDNYIEQQKEKEEMYGGDAHWEWRKRTGVYD